MASLDMVLVCYCCVIVFVFDSIESKPGVQNLMDTVPSYSRISRNGENILNCCGPSTQQPIITHKTINENFRDEDAHFLPTPNTAVQAEDRYAAKANVKPKKTASPPQLYKADYSDALTTAQKALPSKSYLYDAPHSSYNPGPEMNPMQMQDTDPSMPPSSMTMDSFQPNPYDTQYNYGQDDQPNVPSMMMTPPKPKPSPSSIYDLMTEMQPPKENQESHGFYPDIGEISFDPPSKPQMAEHQKKPHHSAKYKQEYADVEENLDYQHEHEHEHEHDYEYEHPHHHEHHEKKKEEKKEEKEKDEDRQAGHRPYSYYYLGRKLWFIPLYFSVYFIIYVTALILHAIARHRVTPPVIGERRSARDLSLHYLNNTTNNVFDGIEKTKKRLNTM